MALYELSEADVSKIEVAARFLRTSIPTEDADKLRNLEKLQPIKPVIAIYTECGLVQGVRGSTDVDVTVIDLDSIEEDCKPIRDADLNPIACNCSTNVAEADRYEHEKIIKDFQAYQALPVAVL